MISESGVQGRKGEKQMRMRSKGKEGIEDEKEGDRGVRSRRMEGARVGNETDENT